MTKANSNDAGTANFPETTADSGMQDVCSPHPSPLLLDANGKDLRATTEAPQFKRAFPVHLAAGLAQEVIERLSHPAVAPRPARAGPSEEDLDRICQALVAEDDHVAEQALADMLPKGASAEHIYLDYLAAAARLLGNWWLDDRANFVEVTVGIGRIFAVLRRLRGLKMPTFDDHRVSVVFASVPGEQHTLGVRMAADLFRGDGWDVALKIGLTQEELVANISNRPKCIVGLSVGGTHSLAALSRLVEALRRSCPNATLLVSGQDIDEMRPQLAALGVDGIAHDIDEAKLRLSAMWDREVAKAERND